MKLSPFVAMVIGFVFAYWFYIVNPEVPKRLAENQRPLYLFLKNKWYFDELYDVHLCQTGPGYRAVLLETRGRERH